ncbi:MAG: glycoside hydrolase family 25 protein [Pelolinea sp.]|nr:glycoside hydrolase family 25 protein [Pelolinea sp.]
MIPGIDVSHWQKEIDWRAVKNSGVRFAFYKASEFWPGQTKITPDPQLLNNARGTAENRIHAAPYHFYRTHIPPITQAFAFLDLIKDLTYSLPPVIDLELAGKRGLSLCEDVQHFCVAIEAELGVLPIIYTSGGFWRSYMILDKFDNVLRFAGYPFWLAQWGFTMPKPVYPFAACSFWQYSQTGRIPGVITHVDLNYFMGGEIELLQFIHKHPIQKPKPLPPPR